MYIPNYAPESNSFPRRRWATKVRSNRESFSRIALVSHTLPSLAHPHWGYLPTTSSIYPHPAADTETPWSRPRLPLHRQRNEDPEKPGFCTMSKPHAPLSQKEHRLVTDAPGTTSLNFILFLSSFSNECTQVREARVAEKFSILVSDRMLQLFLVRKQWC